MPAADSREAFLRKAYGAGRITHLWPAYAACEAALESAWGASRLCGEGCNLFGEKQHVSPIYETLTLPTREFLNGTWVTVRETQWVKFPDWAASFESRMKTLRRLAPTFVEYAAALQAMSGEEFVRQVSKRWSTDPLRGEKVLAIYVAHEAFLRDLSTGEWADS